MLTWITHVIPTTRYLELGEIQNIERTVRQAIIVY